MDSKKLKKILKPIIKECVQECIKETIFEQGVLSGIIKEVAEGMNLVNSQAQLLETREIPQQHTNNASSYSEILQRSRQVGSNRKSVQKLMKESKQKLESQPTKKILYNGKNVFQGTQPLKESTSLPIHMQNLNTQDPGVDLSSGILGKIFNKG